MPLERPDLEKFFGKSHVLEDPQTVIPKDKYPIEFVAYTYSGVEVYKDQPDPVDVDKLETITTLDGLKKGDKIIVPGIVGDYFRCTYEGNDGKYISNDVVFGWLSFNKDDRHCWVCDGLASRSSLARCDFQ